MTLNMNYIWFTFSAFDYFYYKININFENFILMKVY